MLIVGSVYFYSSTQLYFAGVDRKLTVLKLLTTARANIFGIIFDRSIWNILRLLYTIFFVKEIRDIFERDDDIL